MDPGETTEFNCIEYKYKTLNSFAVEKILASLDSKIATFKREITFLEKQKEDLVILRDELFFCFNNRVLFDGGSTQTLKLKILEVLK